MSAFRGKADIDAATLTTSVGVRQRDAYEKSAGTMHLMRRGLYEPACPIPLVLGAIQKILAGIA